jgi:hypothetical protein
VSAPQPQPHRPRCICDPQLGSLGAMGASGRITTSASGVSGDRGAAWFVESTPQVEGGGGVEGPRPFRIPNHARRPREPEIVS